MQFFSCCEVESPKNQLQFKKIQNYFSSLSQNGTKVQRMYTSSIDPTLPLNSLPGPNDTETSPGSEPPAQNNKSCTTLTPKSNMTEKRNEETETDETGRSQKKQEKVTLPTLNNRQEVSTSLADVTTRVYITTPNNNCQNAGSTPGSNRFGNCVPTVLKEAHELLKHEKVRKAHNLLMDELQVANPKKRELILKNKVFKVVNRRFNIIGESLNLFTGKDNGWIEAGVHKGVRTCWKEEKSSRSHSIMVEGIVEAPLVQVALVAGEMGQFVEWFPMLKEMKIVKEYGPYSGVSHMLQSLPWPLSCRDYVTERCVDINPEEGYVVIAFKSMPNHNFEDSTVEAPPVPPHYVRAEILQGGTYMKPLGPKRTLLKAIGNLDLKIPIIPSSILNNLARHVSLTGFRNLSQMATLKEGKLYDWYESRKKDMWDAVYCHIQEVADMKKPRVMSPRMGMRSPNRSPVRLRVVPKNPQEKKNEKNKNTKNSPKEKKQNSPKKNRSPLRFGAPSKKENKDNNNNNKKKRK